MKARAALSSCLARLLFALCVLVLTAGTLALQHWLHRDGAQLTWLGQLAQAHWWPELLLWLVYASLLIALWSRYLRWQAKWHAKRRTAQADQASKPPHLAMGLLAHEFKRPLQRLMFAVDALKPTVSNASDQSTPTEASALAQQIDQAFNDLESLLDESVYLARLNEGALSLTRSHFDVQTWIETLVQQVMAHYPACCWEIQAAAATPDAFQADRYWLSRAVSNLLMNAAKHGARHGRVSWQWHGSGLLLLLQDDGPGIDESLRERVFEPFYSRVRADDTARESAAHLRGLGLALVRGVAESHGGSVGVSKSNLGGSAFVMSLPIAAE